MLSKSVETQQKHSNKNLVGTVPVANETRILKRYSTDGNGNRNKTAKRPG